MVKVMVPEYKTDYEILGIASDAPEEDIKQAYRRIAHQCHPDKNSNPEALEMFRQATRAYNNLINKEIYKSEYKPQKQKNRKGHDIKVSINVKLDETIKGAKKRIATTRKGKCPECNGTGSAQKKVKVCTYCNGSGFQGMALVSGQKKDCLLCDGAGVIPEGNKCIKCSGTGIASETIYKDITLTPFSDRITIHGMGNYCINGGYGNLIIEVYKEKHPFYTVHGLNVVGALTISPAQAIIGDKICMDVFGNQEEVLITPGTPNGHLIEKPNAGIKFENKQGWLKIRVRVAIPPVITAEEKSHYEQILKIEKEAPCLRTLNL